MENDALTRLRRGRPFLFGPVGGLILQARGDSFVRYTLWNCRTSGKNTTEPGALQRELLAQAGGGEKRRGKSTLMNILFGMPVIASDGRA